MKVELNKQELELLRFWFSIVSGHRFASKSDYELAKKLKIDK